MVMTRFAGAALALALSFASGSASAQEFVAKIGHLESAMSAALYAEAAAPHRRSAG